MTDIALMPKSDMLVLHDLFFNLTKTREDVLNLESVIKNMPTAFEECPYPLFHSFADGMYTREIHINAGDLVVGAIHRNEYFVRVLKGRLWVVSEFGSKEILAPNSFVAKAGVKHIVFTLEDTVWTDTHRTDKTKIKEAEAEIFVDSYEELDRDKSIHNTFGLDIDDEALHAYKKTTDLIEQPEAWVEVSQSEINGNGVFVTHDIKPGEKITARIDNGRTPAGRYTNHSEYPNSEPILEDNKGYFSALREIKKGDEITVNYRDVRDKARLLDGYILCQGS